MLTHTRTLALQVRLYAIDAPEKTQSCNNSKGQPYMCGQVCLRSVQLAWQEESQHCGLVLVWHNASQVASLRFAVATWPLHNLQGVLSQKTGMLTYTHVRVAEHSMCLCVLCMLCR